LVQSQQTEITLLKGDTASIAAGLKGLAREVQGLRAELDKLKPPEPCGHSHKHSNGWCPDCRHFID
jgi:hypothetical protein